MKIVSISENPTGDENLGQEEVLEIIRAAPVIRQFDNFPIMWLERALIRENIFYFNWHLSNNHKPLINLGPDSKLTRNVPGLGSKL